MEQEYFISGYCRCLDNSRMVEIIVEDGKITEVDCGFTDCPHSVSCEVAKKIRALAQE